MAASARILLLEDHGDTARVLSRLLMLDGHDLSVARTLAEAQRLCDECRFDLLLADLQLPDGLAWDLIGRVIAAGMKVIVVSADGLALDILRARNMGCEEYLVKPMTTEALRRAIDAATT